MNPQSQRVVNALLLGVTIAFVGACIMSILSVREVTRGPAAGNIHPLGYYYTAKVVRLVRTNNAGGKDTFCSGVVIGKHHMATAYHCLAGFYPQVDGDERGNPIAGKLPKVEIRLADDHPTKTILTLNNITEGSSQVDYVIFKGDFSAFQVQPPVKDPYALYSNIFRGQPITVCGFPMGHELFCERLTIYGVLDFQIQVVGQLLPGMSGGPGFLDDGTVVSVNSAVHGETSLLSPLASIPADSTK